jgi:hypothetical protein
MDDGFGHESVGIWNSFDAQNQGILDLPAHKKLACRATATWTHQIGEHRALSGHRVDDALEMAEQTEI